MAAGNGGIVKPYAPTVEVSVQDLMRVLPRVPPFGRTTAEQAALARQLLHAELGSCQPPMQRVNILARRSLTVM